ncbi:hypothetical protein [Epilithonimonas tenax]|nr:hypothetical protein [Epilithonimonas tenax]
MILNPMNAYQGKIKYHLHWLIEVIGGVDAHFSLLRLQSSSNTLKIK